MQPKHANCNHCHARLRLFMEETPKNCPKCGTLLRHEEFEACGTCKGRVALGVKTCEACKLSKDPTHSSYPASSPGTQGSVN